MGFLYVLLWWMLVGVCGVKMGGLVGLLWLPVMLAVAGFRWRRLGLLLVFLLLYYFEFAIRFCNRVFTVMIGLRLESSCLGRGA